MVAREKADKMFEDRAFRPRSYTTELDTWERYVGVRNAEYIHGLLVFSREENGAVPARIEIDVS
jgi:uncharacterized protein YmfQ (DUF2313 family)